MKSLAITHDFPYQRGVAVNREMLVWSDGCRKKRAFCTAWTGQYFFTKEGEGHQHACEVETDENSFVRDGVRYGAETYESCMTCGANDFRGRLAGSCMEIIGISCNSKMRHDNRNIQWKRADTQTRPMTLEERVEALERKLEKVG